MRLIVTEKDNSAKKIAQILSGGEAKQNKSYGIPHYSWDGSDGGHTVIGLKGHLMNPAFPEGYSDWRKIEPRELIFASLVKEPLQKSVHKALRKQAKDAELDRDRDRLRPRGRADRPRGARGDAGREPRPAQTGPRGRCRRASSAPSTRR